ncbi:MAG: hypothetical protein GY926_00075 [bacterium]|nr:hypothetical protein [bacterium]MCP4963615.1 hypothetical protein [bacterium]
MLSWSIEETRGRLNVLAISQPTLDPLIPGGSELLAYVDATLSGDDIATARNAVVAAISPEAAVDAAAVTGNFEMMNRIADGVGMPVGGGTRQRMRQIITDLQLDRFPHA